MAYDEASGDQVARSGLLINVEPVPAAADRGKANGAVADNDGND